jgi:hypothetical protein
MLFTGDRNVYEVELALRHRDTNVSNLNLHFHFLSSIIGNQFSCDSMLPCLRGAFLTPVFAGELFDTLSVVCDH